MRVRWTAVGLCLLPAIPCTAQENRLDSGETPVHLSLRRAQAEAGARSVPAVKPAQPRSAPKLP